MKKRNLGFSLIELMIVLVIIGILTMSAVPAYHDYTVRARVMEGLNMASAAKLAVAETVLANNALPKNQAETGYVSPASTANVQSIQIENQTAIVTIIYTKAAGNGTLEFHPILHEAGDLAWVCRGGSLLDKYRPSMCRN